jgi:NAD(P)-dependent dehydrogenase (short-subunit alcohol dehydrogenase family)
MRDSALRLQDKTILLTGPFNGTTQALIRMMTEFGCDIAFISDQTPAAARYIEGVNEGREIRPGDGRAAYLHLPTRDGAEIKEALGRMVETFGRMDVLIDAHPLTWNESTETESALARCRHLAEGVIPFLLAKQKGRLMYLFEDECVAKLGLPTLPARLREALAAHIGAVALDRRQANITVNGLSIGVTEDFILRHFAAAGSIRKSVDELRARHPGVKLVESTDIGLGAAYLASALSGSLTGQILRLTHGFHIDSI